MGSEEELYDGASDDGSDERPFAHTSEGVEADEAERSTKERHTDVGSGAHRAVRAAETDGKEVLDGIDGEHGDIGSELEKGTVGEDDTASDKGEELRGVVRGGKGSEAPHSKVDERTEGERDEHLHRNLHPLTTETLHKDLDDDEGEGIEDHPPAEGEGGEYEREAVGESRDGGGAEGGFGQEDNAKGNDDETHEEGQITARETHSVGH